EANSICHSFGANVASIHNDQENNFVRRLAVSKGLINGVMLVGTVQRTPSNGLMGPNSTTTILLRVSQWLVRASALPYRQTTSTGNG
ncbi:hypothetical protein PRIPAC_83495, partial [Pristionchus pacificus]